MKFFFNKIGTKLILILSVTILIILFLFTYFTLSYHYDNLVYEIEQNADQLSETIRQSVRYDMLANRREHVHNIINQIGENHKIKNLRILNKEGEIIYSIHQKEIGEMVNKDAESCYACHNANQPLEKLTIKERTRTFRIDPDSSRTLGIINPIYNEPSCWEAECHAHEKEKKVLGVLDVAVSLKEIDSRIKRSSNFMILFAIAALLLIAVVLKVSVKFLIQKPINELVEATNLVAIGNLNHRIKYSRSDELGQLSQSFNNMTKRLSEMRIQLVQSDKLASLGKLAAGVAHEINNPLTGVLTYSSYLLKRVKDNQEFKSDLEVIVRETKRSREIVKSLLDFSRQSMPKLGKLNLNEVIENAIAIIHNQLKINKITLTKNFYDDLPEIPGDANQIQQVIINLLVNSIDAINGKHGKINISTKSIQVSPYGSTIIREATCPKGHSLMDSNHKISGRPSIKVKVKSSKNEGFVHLNPIYGNHNHFYGIEFNKNEEIKLFCPHCGVSLVDETDLGPDCKSPVYKIIIPNQGELIGCTRFGCNWQKWEYIDQNGNTNFVEIKISDNGSGIEKENLDKIFDPFFTTKGKKGTGLGLSVIWGIIENHKGKIMVDSELNKGTTFIIHLPVK